tara:strand:- start:8597 stop:9049 length:453 start_codon:yes stop_codon:yes gene_type:complete
MKIRKAKFQDVKIYWSWFNDTEVKKNSFHYKRVSYKEHCEWFDKKINDKNNYLYIALIKNVPCSQIRIELKENQYILSYSVDKAFRMKGLGKKTLLLVLKRLSNLKNFKKLPIIAKVKKQNIPSIKVFEFLNFQKKIYKDYLIFQKKLNY